MDQHQPVLLQHQERVQRQQTIASADIDLYPITSNEGERSFSQLKDLLTSDHYGRAAAKQPDADGSPQVSLVRNLQCYCNWKFNGKQRMVTFAGDTVIEDDENWEDNTLNLLLIFSSRITPYYNFLENLETLFELVRIFSNLRASFNLLAKDMQSYSLRKVSVCKSLFLQPE